MKKKRITALVLSFIFLFGSLTVFAGSSFSYDEEYLEKINSSWSNIQSDDTVISLVPGQNAGEIRFSWLSRLTDKNNDFMVSKNKDMSDAEHFEVNSTSSLVGKTVNKVTVSGLSEGKSYYYSYTENGKWSEPCKFTVQPSDSFTALFVSDSQIGRSGDAQEDEVLIRDTAGWNHTVETALKTVDNAAFILSAGDQVELGYSLKEYKAFLSPEELRSVPVAAAIGNHDFYFPLYSYYFNNPNIVNETTPSPAGKGYFFSYGNVLFIVPNSNNMNPIDINNLIKNAYASHPDAEWKVVLMHHSPYSAKTEEGEFSFSRLMFAPLFDAYGIDIVLCGHDHMYSRSKTIFCGSESEYGGTVYIQASSASGSNFDKIGDHELVYTESALDYVATYSSLTFSGETVSVNTYRTDTNEIIDSAEIHDRDYESSNILLSWLISFYNILVSFF